MILIINNSKQDALALSETFYYMGILSRGVTPREAKSEISPLYKAALLMDPEDIPLSDELIYVLRTQSSALIFGLTKSYGTEKYFFDAVLKNTFYSAETYESICSYFKNRDLPPPGIYRTQNIDASANLKLPLYMNSPLNFTKSETMILRTLISSYPIPKSSKDILKYAFRENRAPDRANVRTHISIMNKKFRDMHAKQLIEFSHDIGYTISLRQI